MAAQRGGEEKVDDMDEEYDPEAPVAMTTNLGTPLYMTWHPNKDFTPSTPMRWMFGRTAS